MAPTLAIVERSHRGTVEQQYAHVLWLVHGLHRQSPMTLLLRGGAAVYALDAPPAGPVRVGGVPWGSFPDYHDALRRLRVDGAGVWVSGSSLARLGMVDFPLLPGIGAVTDQEIVKMMIDCDRIWYL